MDAVCEECGDVGFRRLLLRCSKCRSAVRHRYCLDAIIFDSVVDWSCSGCIPKHNEAIKSLEDASNQMHLSNMQLGCSMINEPNVDNEKVTKARRPRTIRPRRKRKYHVDESSKHFPIGDTSNLGQCRNKPHKERRVSSDAITAQFCSGDAIDSCEVFVGDIPNRNDCEKEGEDRNGHSICAAESSDGSSDLPLDHASEFEPNNLQKAMDSSKLASNSTECTDLSNVRSGCFAAAKHVEGLVPRGGKGDLFSVTNDVEGSLPMIVDKSCPTLASVEQAVGLSVNRKPEPLKAVKGLEKSGIASKSAPDRSKPIEESELKTWSADVSSPRKQRLDSWSMVPMQSSPSNELECVAVQENSAAAKHVEGLIPRGGKGDLFSVTNDVEGSLPMIVDKSCPTLASVEQALGLSVNGEPEPLKAVKGLEKSGVASKSAPDRSKPIEESELKSGSADVLSPRKQRLDSWSMVPMQSSPSNELECVAVQENSAERTRCLVDKQIDTPTMLNLKVSRPSMENDCLVSNEGNSGKANTRSDEVLLSTKGKRMQRRMSGDREIVSSYVVNGISNPDSAKGDRDARNLQRNAGQPSSLDFKKALLKRVLQEEATNSELSSSKFVGPCESTKINPRKRKQSGIYTPDGTKYQRATITNENKIVNDARSKGGRPAPETSLRDGQNMSREDNGSNDKVIGHSKKKKYKKMDKSWLANKASRDSWKCGMVTNVLQPSSLHTSSVDKSRPFSGNVLLNNPRSSREPTLRSGNLNHLYSKNHKEVTKRSIDASKDENASLIRNLNAGCAESDVSQLALQTVVKEGYCGIPRMPLISECIDTRPLDKPYWTGIMKIDNNYISLAAHLSTKACKKVQEHSRSLPPRMEVTKFSTSKTCPKHLEAAIPSADSIGLYFFSSDTRSNKELDQLVKHVADSGIILEAIVGLAKLFLFPSSVLPEEYQTFQGKPFLWGVFKPRKYKMKGLTPVEQDCSAHVSEEEHVQEQHVLDQQGKAHADTLDQVVHSENQPLLGANQEVRKEVLSGNVLPLVDMKDVVSANIIPADHGQPCSNPEAPLKLCGIVVSRTPRCMQLIQEMQKEGAFLFAVQQVMTEHGSVV